MSQSDDHRLLDALYADDADVAADEVSEFEALSDTLAMMQQLDEVEPPPFLTTRILAEAREAQAKPSGWARWLKLAASPLGGLAATAALATVVVVATLPTMQTQEPVADFEPMSEMAQKPAAAPAARPKLAAEEEQAAVGDRDKSENLNSMREGNAPARVRRSFPRDAEEVEQAPTETSLDDVAADQGGRAESAYGSGTRGAGAAEPTVEVPRASSAKSKKRARRQAPARPARAITRKNDANKDADVSKKGALADSSDLARTFLAAAEAELKAGRPGAARRVLARGVEQTRGQAAQAQLYLRWAELELADRQPTMARGYLEQAMRVKGFQDHKRAHALDLAIQRLESDLNPPK